MRLMMLPLSKRLMLLGFVLFVTASLFQTGFAYSASLLSSTTPNAGFLQREVKAKRLLGQLGASSIEGSQGLYLLDLETLTHNQAQLTPAHVRQALKPWQLGRVADKKLLGCNPNDEALRLFPHDKQHQLVLCWSKGGGNLHVIVPKVATHWVLAPYGLRVGQQASQVERLLQLKAPQAQTPFWSQSLSPTAELRVYLSETVKPLQKVSKEAPEDVKVSHWAIRFLPKKASGE